MKKRIKLTEKDLAALVRSIMSEQIMNNPFGEMISCMKKLPTDIKNSPCIKKIISMSKDKTKSVTGEDMTKIPECKNAPDQYKNSIKSFMACLKNSTIPMNEQSSPFNARFNKITGNLTPPGEKDSVKTPNEGPCMGASIMSMQDIETLIYQPILSAGFKKRNATDLKFLATKTIGKDSGSEVFMGFKLKAPSTKCGPPVLTYRVAVLKQNVDGPKYPISPKNWIINTHIFELSKAAGLPPQYQDQAGYPMYLIFRNSEKRLVKKFKTEEELSNYIKRLAQDKGTIHK